LKAAYKAWYDTKGIDGTVWLPLFDDAFKLASAGAGQPGMNFANVRNSKQEAIDYLASLAKNWRTIHWTPQAYVCDGDNIAMCGMCAWENKATGKTAEVRTAQH
jgi:uncharacterized protein